MLPGIVWKSVAATHERSSTRWRRQPTTGVVTGNFALFKPPSIRRRPSLCCHNYHATANPIGHLAHSSHISKTKKKNPSEGFICRRQWKKKKHDSSAKKRTSSKRQTPSKVKVCPLKSVSAAAFCGYEASWMHCQVLLDKAYGSEISIPFCKRARRHFLLLAHYLTLT